uniref:DUF389 domain-containing protein n=1 Tax=Hirondellea gigas TaxID=1518452 RepID=A0A6A7G696_9CRUS
MVRRVVVTVPKERAQEVLTTMEDARHCHHITIMMGDTDFPQFSASVITFQCIDKKLWFIISELESIGLGVDFGTIELMALEAVVPYLSSRIDARGVRVPNRITSVTDRLTIAEIYTAIDDQCHMTFDYLAMCATAGMICGVGLLDDNVVLVVASMLVSPLMGPILAIIYGTMMKDGRMGFKGLRAEISGVLMIFLVGMLCGAVVAPFADRELGEWPTENFQMNIRGEPLNLVVGTFIAIPSGVALALAITSDVVAPYVGVAIAAALLPPIVNGGLTLMLGIISLGMEGSTPHTAHYLTTAYISMILFLINFVLIYVFGIFTFMVKRVRPGTEHAKQTYLYRYSVFDNNRGSIGSKNFLDASNPAQRRKGSSFMEIDTKLKSIATFEDDDQRRRNGHRLSGPS